MVLRVPKSPKSSEEFRRVPEELQVFGRFRWCDANILDQKFSSPVFPKVHELARDPSYVVL